MHQPGQTTSWATNQDSVNLRKLKLLPSIFSDHNSVRLDINYRKKKLQKTNSWRLNNTLLNNKEVTEEIRREIKIPRNK